MKGRYQHIKACTVYACILKFLIPNMNWWGLFPWNTSSRQAPLPPESQIFWLLESARSFFVLGIESHNKKITERILSFLETFQPKKHETLYIHIYIHIYIYIYIHTCKYTNQKNHPLPFLTLKIKLQVHPKNHLLTTNDPSIGRIVDVHRPTIAALKGQASGRGFGHSLHWLRLWLGGGPSLVGWWTQVGVGEGTKTQNKLESWYESTIYIYICMYVYIIYSIFIYYVHNNDIEYRYIVHYIWNMGVCLLLWVT